MPNRLSHETSPYLRQHAGNPVDWHPWGPEAFARARAEDKPIFLSIGYSTCHWCHVMARESFEDPAIADLLNESFVAIKVDREERPDVDRVYMSYVQALTGRGGWPLSAWLTPELKPFYGGTYFPPEDRQGRPGFPTVLRALAAGWAGDRGKLLAEAERVVESLRGQSRAEQPPAAGGPAPAADPQASLHENAAAAFEKCFHFFYQGFDHGHGGFGGAPKFPRASNLSFLFRCAALQGPASELGREAVNMAAYTLVKMAGGGIHDHVGGGFHRYAVDADWFVPHFEKMLYDQAQIAGNALDAWQATGDERMAWLARDILDYVLRELTDPAGGFHSAEDADSTPPGRRTRRSMPRGRSTSGPRRSWTPPSSRPGPRLSRPISACRPGATSRRRRIRSANSPARTSSPKRAPWARPPGPSAWSPRRRATCWPRAWSSCAPRGRPARGPGGTTRSSPPGTA